MTRVEGLRIKIFGDGANKESILELAEKPYIRGFTTNPTLMRAAGVVDYETFARDMLSIIAHLPISFEVFSDDLDGMEQQARRIASWAKNVYVKIPITTTSGESTLKVVQRLSGDGVKINVTALLPLEQVRQIVPAFAVDTPGIVSVFAGRIADTGRDPGPLMRDAKAVILDSGKGSVELLWASPRQVLDIFRADEVGCDIITVTPDILKKLSLIGKDLGEYSLETVKMFYEDAKKAGYSLT